MRKITYGNRSMSGALNHNILTSVIQTAKMNGVDVIDTLKSQFVNGKNKALLKVITSPP
ncbi:MAG: hypothetical protein WCV56_08385 [Candidatus Omnitrophota bacterium]